MSEHEHKHDETCDCGHDHGHENHDHDHHHHDHHHHEHGDDCDCGHEHEHHDEAEAFAESALRKSARRVVMLDTPTSAREIAAKKMAALSEIAELVAFEDIILGHIKALLDFGETKVTISITRLDECKQSFDWADFLVESYIFTVNILSLHNVDTDLDDLWERLLSS